ncbi:hypothetical protein B296_00002381 [Ensete ventricosum]|uniref:Uncharacterized protein n=1 Tax=Ensete ventricosum TaxID=4639 RepID=A0A427AXR7_ENSVE|nr:hypothetical protein B296_00002381 [Ensete ventricosum]
MVGTTWWDSPRNFWFKRSEPFIPKPRVSQEVPFERLRSVHPLRAKRNRAVVSTFNSIVRLGFSRRESFRSPTVEGEGERVGVLRVLLRWMHIVGVLFAEAEVSSRPGPTLMCKSVNVVICG